MPTIKRFTEAQMDLVEDELCRIGEVRDINPDLITTTATTVTGPVDCLLFLADGIELRLDDDLEQLCSDRFEDDRELTDAQLALAVKARIRCIKATVKKLRSIDV